MELGKRIKAWREHAGLTNATAAKRLGIAWESQYQWEIGKTQPTQRNLQAFVKIIGISMSRFYGEIPPRKKAVRS